METLLSKFNTKINLEEIRKDLFDMSSKQMTHEEVPSGLYEVKVEKMEIRPTRKEDPMLSIWFRILDGKYKNQFIFFNRVLTTGKNISMACTFMRSLKTGVEVEFEDFVQYNDVIQEVFTTINRRRYEFALKYTRQENGFDEHEIKEVFEV